MLEHGQPLHASTWTRCAGATLVARRAQRGRDARSTLDGKERPLWTRTTSSSPTARPGRPRRRDGRRGQRGDARRRRGCSSRARSSRRRAVRRTAQAPPDPLRGLAPLRARRRSASGARRALDRFTEVILEIAGGRVGRRRRSITSHRPHTRARRSRCATRRREGGARREGAVGRGRRILAGLGLKVVEDGTRRSTVEVPGFRRDLDDRDRPRRGGRARPRLRPHPPRIPGGAGADAQEAARDRRRAAPARRALRRRLRRGAELRLRRAASLALLARERQADRARNPLASEQAAMRTSLSPGLLENLAHNLRHGVEPVRALRDRPHLPPAHRKRRGRPRAQPRPGSSIASRSASASSPPARAAAAGPAEGRRSTSTTSRARWRRSLDALGVDGVAFAREAASRTSTRARRRSSGGRPRARPRRRAAPGDRRRPRAAARRRSSASSTPKPLLAAARLVPPWKGLARFPAEPARRRRRRDDAVTAADVLPRSGRRREPGSSRRRSCSTSTRASRSRREEEPRVLDALPLARDGPSPTTR